MIQKPDLWQTSTNKIFVENLPHIQELESQDTEFGRFYCSPSGELYPSITTVLNDSTTFASWQEKVGEQFANEYTKRAQIRGIDYHNYSELYLKNESFKYKTIIDKNDFKKHFIPVLDKVNNIHHIEKALWSDKLKVAGRTDLIAEYNGILSIIDYKTSTNIKYESDLDKFLIQATAYGLMYFERTGIQVKQVVILCYVEHDKLEVFVKPLQVKKTIKYLEENVGKYRTRKI